MAARDASRPHNPADLPTPMLYTAVSAQPTFVRLLRMGGTVAKLYFWGPSPPKGKVAQRLLGALTLVPLIVMTPIMFMIVSP